MKKKILVVVIVICMLLTFVCGCNPGDGYDPNRTQIFVSVYSGGYGHAWIETLATEFNASQEEFEVVIKTNKDLSDRIIPALQAGTSEYDLYLTSNMPINDLIGMELAADISDVYDKDVDGNGTTIRQKIKDQEFLTAYSDEAGKIYMVPFADSLAGFIYDHDLFMEKGLYNYQADGVTLTVGKDGVAGTYDDGQPTNLTEWQDMIDRIAVLGIEPFIVTGQFKNEYTQPIFEAAWAQYDGPSQYDLIYTYNGTYTAPSTGVQTTITPATGYLTMDMEGKMKALEFLKTYLANLSYQHPAIESTSYSHEDTQGLFITGYQKASANPESALLCDGVWWENEARNYFNNLSNMGVTDRGFGKREYRFMLLPAFDGQKGIDGTGKGSVLATNDHSNMFVKAQSDADRVRGAKDFLAYTLTDEALRMCTSTTGAIRPFKYQLSSEELANVTPFVKNALELYNDTDNIAIVRPIISHQKTPINYIAGVDKLSTKIGSDPQTINTLTVLLSYSAQQYFDGAKTVYNATTWAALYDSVRSKYEG